MLLALAAFAGCSTLGYYLQAFNGQMELTRKARPIPQVLDDEHTPAELKARLEQVQKIRSFASRDLALPGQRQLPPLCRPEAALRGVECVRDRGILRRARQWCFPIAGCVGYRGYFAQDAADTFAVQSARPAWMCTWAAFRPTRPWDGWTTRF